MKETYISTVNDIATIVGGEILCGDRSKKIESISTDSRNMGEKSLYIPIIGEKFDGHDFIEGLVKEKKISAFLTSNREYKKIAEENNCAAIYCENTLHSLGSLSHNHRLKFDIPVVGITGTNGKTTTKELVSSILAYKFNTLKNEKNYNNEIGVPFTLMKLNKDHQGAVIEMGMNHAGEISRLSKMVCPDISIITNAGEGHLEFLGTVENVAHAKSEIFHGMKESSTLILNKDTACYEIFREKAAEKSLKITTYGLDSAADIYPDSYKLLPDMIVIQYKGEEISVPLYGVHNVYNIMAAIGTAEYYSIDVKDIKKALENFTNVDKRSEIIERGFSVINDTYNSNPLSLRSALKSINNIYPDNRKIAVISDMKELGDLSEKYHRQAGVEVCENNFEKLYTWGKMSKWVYEGALEAGLTEESAHYFEKKEELIEQLKKDLKEQDVVLIKGSRSMKMEEVTEAIIK